MPKVCEKGGEDGWFVPMFDKHNERSWSKSVRAVLYGIIMCYCFLGAAIVSNFFMAAIEAITGKKKRVLDKENDRYVTLILWNDTVANLTLLALGSSAPEILLSIVEVLKNDFKAGELGPSTIVGSAAFNTFCIIAVCIIAIPTGECRHIRGVRVYHVTVVFATIAYLWLLMICSISSPDVISIAEAVITLVLFFLLVAVAFWVDKFEERKLDEEEHRQAELAAEKATARLTEKARIGEEDGLVEFQHPKKKVRHLLAPKLKMILHHKEMVVRRAESKLFTRLSQQRMSIAKVVSERPDLGLNKNNAGLSDSIAALVSRCPPAGEISGTIMNVDGHPIRNRHGVLTFLVDSLEVKGCPHDTVFSVPVIRRNGASGDVSCNFRSESLGAVPGFDFSLHGNNSDNHSGELVFPSGCVMQEILVTIRPQRHAEASESFQVILDEPRGEVEFNPNDDGKGDCCILTVTIANGLDDDISASLGNKLYETLVDPELLGYGLELWKQQIIEATKANTETDDPPTFAEQAMHIISFPWKITFATLAPPPIFMGGWVLFVVALSFIGILTALVSDLAETFGCCLGLDNPVTAIIIVAPGTSLPDLFASQAAALSDENADASIVNVTGSNSVNVFLGIGLPWTIAAIYWRAKGEVGAPDTWLAKNPDAGSRHPDGAFIVEAGALGFSVVVFTSCSLICLGILRIKRVLTGGELGGDGILSKHCVAAGFVLLWVWYLTWNIIKSKTDAADVGQWISLAACILSIVAVIAVELAAKYGILKDKNPTHASLDFDAALSDQINRWKRDDKPYECEARASLRERASTDPSPTAPGEKAKLLDVENGAKLSNDALKLGKQAEIEPEAKHKSVLTAETNTTVGTSETCFSKATTARAKGKKKAAPGTKSVSNAPKKFAKKDCQSPTHLDSPRGTPERTPTQCPNESGGSAGNTDAL